MEKTRKLMLEEVNALITAASKSEKRDELLDDIARLQEAKRAIAEAAVKDELDAIADAIRAAETVGELLEAEAAVEKFYGEKWYLNIPLLGRFLAFWVYE